MHKQLMMDDIITLTLAKTNAAACVYICVECFCPPLDRELIRSVSPAISSLLFFHQQLIETKAPERRLNWQCGELLISTRELEINFEPQQSKRCDSIIVIPSRLWLFQVLTFLYLR